MSERIQNVDHHEEIVYNGRKIRSKLELKTAETLDRLGIPYLYEERKITLIDKFRCPYQKDMIRGISYTPDFIIGPIILECKGFETPEWKIKKKLVFKWLMENEPDVLFYQIHDARRELLKALDPHWSYLGYAIRVTSKKKKKKEQQFSRLYDSVAEALADLNIKTRALGSIMRSLTGKTQYVFGYNWKLEKLSI